MREKHSDERRRDPERVFHPGNYIFRRIMHFQNTNGSISEGIAKAKEYQESSKNA